MSHRSQLPISLWEDDSQINNLLQWLFSHQRSVGGHTKNLEWLNDSPSPFTAAQDRASTSGQPSVCSGLVVESLGSSFPCSAFLGEIRVPTLISQLAQVFFQLWPRSIPLCQKKTNLFCFGNVNTTSTHRNFHTQVLGQGLVREHSQCVG